VCPLRHDVAAPKFVRSFLAFSFVQPLRRLTVPYLVDRIEILENCKSLQRTKGRIQSNQ
jgi:hypothetical protein